MLRLLFVVVVIFIGLSNGVGVLPDGPLIASVGGTVNFTTDLNPTETPFTFVNWQFDNGSKPQFIIISQSTGDTTAPEYEGRLTLFRSTGSLELRDLKLSDSGEYTVTIQDGMNQPIGRTTLNVYEPVSNVNVSLLSSDLIEFNSSVSLFCSSSGSSLSFLWMKDGSEVTDSERVQINTNEENSNLTIVNVTRNDKGSYTCHVSNLVSSVISDPVKISVSYGPDNVQIEVYPSKEHHEKGSDINLTCSADSTPSAEYQWFLNGDKLTSSGPLLRLINIQMSQSGNYSCQAFNSKTLISQTSEPSPVSVHERVSNVKVTQDVTHLIEFNGSVSFSCSSFGSSLSFLWMNSSSQITTSDRVQITDGGSKLTIVNVTRYDDGSYSCDVSNPVSSAKSYPVNVSVSYGPEKVNLESPSQKYPEGLNISLSCSADSRPTATFDWFFNGKVLSGSGSELELLNVQKNQSGNYSCRAFNSKTSIYQSSQLLNISIEGTSTKGSSLSAGAIAGIVIACLVCASLIVLGAYFILKKKKPWGKTSNRNISAGGNRRDNGEVTYADVRFSKNKKPVQAQWESDNPSSTYADIRTNRN
ncbi:carcinoembryonic antigen-related cell adhesion molecule 5-like isoform X2 [Xiphophorus couchianus]|uniref:carcinoembryonic antigen-related cell adhesion molecule 5-like isoform X2 n=1 Tax=Xiphophorus couchianus TaxID=32473 RepID=UPI001015D1EB|nr:carcinoembryonic antigen-related cell adhesion molecule 5-like isoform X2 [Xiphophorus couchianus]